MPPWCLGLYQMRMQPADHCNVHIGALLILFGTLLEVFFR